VGGGLDPHWMCESFISGYVGVLYRNMQRIDVLICAPGVKNG
jgi:hypothetical protein